MAAGETTTGASAIKMFEEVVLSITDDDGFTLPTQQSKLCLEMARSLLELCRHGSPSSQAHANWLVNQLNTVICKAKKRGSELLNEERLWSTYHQLSISSSFQQVWERFLPAEQLPNEPLLYQYITDQVLELLLKSKLAITDESTPLEHSENHLTFEEQNAVRYIGGYVIRSLHQKTKDNGVKHVLCELKDEGSMDGPAQEWVNAIDRGGLTKITSEAYHLFNSIELCVRRQLTISRADKMDETFKAKLMEFVMKDDDVLFYWCLAGQIEGDEAADKSLVMIVNMWITIRGFSFARSIMEIYKQETKKGTEKAKSLRSSLFT